MLWAFLEARMKFLESIEKCANDRGLDTDKVMRIANDYADQLNVFPESSRNEAVIGLTTKEMVETFNELSVLLSNTHTQRDAIQFIAENKWLRKYGSHRYTWK